MKVDVLQAEGLKARHLDKGFDDLSVQVDGLDTVDRR
jgi:hypothetical protein